MQKRWGLLDAGARGKLTVVVTAWLAGGAVALAEHPPAGHANELWPPIGLGFLWLTLAWNGQWSTLSRTLPHLGAMLVTFVGLGVVLGWSLLDATHMGVLNVLGGLVMVVGYRLVLGPTRGWAPRTPGHLVGVLVTAIAGTLLVGLLGGFPTLPAFHVTSRLAVWWTIRGSIFAILAALTFLIFFHGDIARWREQSVRAPLSLLVLPTVTIATLLLAYDHERPLSWGLLVPAVWAGLVFTPIGAAVQAIAVALAAAVAAYLPEVNQYQSIGGILPDSYLIDVLLVASAFITIMLALLRDERERALHDLAAQRWRAQSQAALLNRVFESMTDGLIVITSDGRTTHNPAARALLGRRVPDHTDGDGLGYFEIVESGQPLLARGADERLLEVRAIDLGDRVRILLFTDVTAQRRRLDELSSFAGVVAHDLRSPLSGLLGWLEMVEVAAATADMAEVRGLVPRLTSTANRLAQVIEDWVGYALQREGELSHTEVCLAELVEDVISPWAESRAAFHVDAPHRLLVDVPLVRQLLANVVGNAVKFSRPGERPDITITSLPCEHEDWVQVEVADRGVGLAPGEEEKIFEKYHRGATHSDVDGSGLGLALCRRIVTRHGGTIRAHGNRAGGTTIVFTLPTAHSSERTVQAP